MHCITLPGVSLAEQSAKKKPTEEAPKLYHIRNKESFIMLALYYFCSVTRGLLEPTSTYSTP